MEVAPLGPGLYLQRSRLAVGRIHSWAAGILCFGSQAHSPFKGKGSLISLALGVNGLAQSLLMAFAGCAFSMRSLQNYIPMKLYFTQDVKLDLCKSIGTKSQGSEGGRNENRDKQIFFRRVKQKREKTVVKGFYI